MPARTALENSVPDVMMNAYDPITPETSRSDRCAPVDPGPDTALPIRGQPGGGKMKKSAMGRRRATVLVAVHLLMTGHVIHYLHAGKTLSPVEPSEAMYTLRDGYLNAGFIFFAVALLSTLVFGRFVCGWGCHLVAYQDLCGWIMKKLHVKPKPFRSRLMVFVPLGLALYMFAYPSVYRVLFPSPQTAFPGLTNHLMTDAFWKTFPGPVIAVLSVLVCGFAAVYFLGAKGFCTYACPYGGFFAPMDRVSVGRVLVNDDCEQCGHCTANCTSNVRVNEEVKLYGMVVDPGCMKCLDCVSVCPKNALRFGFGAPSVFKGKPEGTRSKIRYDFGLVEELMLVLVLLGTVCAMRGLYDGPPLLASVALGGITAYATLKLWRLLRDPTVRVQNLKIKSAGRLTRAGVMFAGATAVWLLFTAHSGLVQWHRAWGRYYLERTEATQHQVFAGLTKTADYSDQHYAAVEKCFRHFSLADRWGLVDTLEVKLGLAWTNLLRGDVGRAEQLVRAAIAIRPEDRQLHDQLAKVLLLRGRAAEAIDVLESLTRMGSPTAAEHFELAVLLTKTGRTVQAITHYRECIRLAPESHEAYYNLGGLLGRAGQYDQAIQYLQEARRILPGDSDTMIELGLAHAGAGHLEEAVRSLRRAVELAPNDPGPRLQLNMLLRDLRPAPTGPTAEPTDPH